jgi:putative ABC transport system permease protein
MKRPSIRRWISLPLSRAAREREVDAEIALHIALRTQRLVEQGHAMNSAQLEAERRFGGTEARLSLIHHAHDRDTTMTTHEWIENTITDLRFTVRQLLRAPTFTAAAVATIALGVGANATMFGVIDRLLLQPPAHVRAPERVMLPSVTFTSRAQHHTQNVLSFPIFRDLESDSSFLGVAVFSEASLTLGSGQSARELNALRVTPAYFAVLGVRPSAGFFFDPTASSEVPAVPEVVVSEPFWRTTLGASTSAIGQNIELGGRLYRVIGIAPRGFTGTDPSPIDAWIPYAAGATTAEIARWKSERQWYSLQLVARLRDGVTPGAAAATASRAIQAGELRDGDPADRVRKRKSTVTFTSALPRDARGATAASRVTVLLAAMSLFVLLLACANVTNLQLGRAIRRQREVSIRLALGVGRGRLIRLLLTESAVLALLGGLVAMGVAWWGTALMRTTLLAGWGFEGSPINVRMLGYTAAVALGAGLLTGLFPALQSSRPDLITSLRTGGQPAGSRGNLRSWLLVTQSALALVLLIGTGLFARSVKRIESIPLGIDPERVVVATLNTTGRTYDAATLTSMFSALARAASSTPGIERAALTFSLPFGATTADAIYVPGIDTLPLTAEGGPYVNAVGPDYFVTLGTPIIAGRAFTADDREGAAPVAIVNQTAARLWWPGESALGKCVRFDDKTAPCATIIGIAANSRRQSIIEDEFVQVTAPAAQASAWAQPRILLARVRGNPTVAMKQVQRILQTAAPGLPYVSVELLTNRIAVQKKSWRLGATMFGVFGMLAIILAAIGLYGVLAYDVSQRTREIGVRIALGGLPTRISAHIVRQGVSVAGAGCVLGLAAALLFGSRIQPLLFQTSRLDPTVYVCALAVILLTSILASWIPARRAGRVDPAIALQSD